MDRWDGSRRLQSKREIELNQKNTRARWILALVFFLVALAALTYGLVSYLNTDPGWQEVQADSQKINCSGDFVFQYDYSDQGVSAPAARKALTQAYTEATEQACTLFYPDAPEGAGGLRDIQSSVNQPVTVVPELYTALQLVEQYGQRSIYLAPVYAEYQRIFRSESEVEAASFDPGQNPEVAQYVQQLAGFANDPAHIKLELLGDNQIQLTVSQQYQDFAREYEIDTFLDFGWMKNAFIADYIAQYVSEKGYTRGYLVSFDGFTRNLDSSAQSFSFNLLDRQENTVYAPAVLNYKGSASIVSLRNYPLSDRDRWQYYGFENGRIVTAIVDPADGISKSATDNLVGYSETLSCGELLLQLAPVYVCAELDENAIADLAEQGTFCIWFEGTALQHTGQLDIRLNPEQTDPAYSFQP